MNKSYIEWIDYYENATKEDVIQDMMLDINSIKEKDKEIERLKNELSIKTTYIEDVLKTILKSDDFKMQREVYEHGIEYDKKLKELKEGKENKESPELFEGTLEQLDKLSIRRNQNEEG